MKKIKIIYWIFTGLLVALMVLGSIPDIMSVPDAVALFNHLGYPTYLLPFIGIAKLLGVVAILIPGFPRIKEWAYAGFVFDLTGAMYSSISVGDPTSGWLLFIIGYILIAGSYIYHHKILKSATSNITLSNKDSLKI
ncbi:DoxX family protein [Peribacillus simplex]|uniref:DoxX family protein n=1 Tax=Peribacillus simplex TaxID=1478 RepID=UPI0011DC8C6B|nr:DoxX family protein [Peribacillus simplex]